MKNTLNNAIWSGKNNTPKIGDEVTVNMNGLGSGIVTSYEVVDGFLGVRIKLYNPPAWFLDNQKQYNDYTDALVFGIELD